MLKNACSKDLLIKLWTQVLFIDKYERYQSQKGAEMHKKGQFLPPNYAFSMIFLWSMKHADFLETLNLSFQRLYPLQNWLKLSFCLDIILKWNKRKK